MKSGSTLSPRGRQFTVAIVVTNVGVLLSLLFGANSGRPNVVLSALGVGVVVVGLVLLAVAAVRSRRTRSGPDAGR